MMMVSANEGQGSHIAVCFVLLYKCTVCNGNPCLHMSLLCKRSLSGCGGGAGGGAGDNWRSLFPPFSDVEFCRNISVHILKLQISSCFLWFC